MTLYSLLSSELPIQFSYSTKILNFDWNGQYYLLNQVGPHSFFVKSNAGSSVSKLSIYNMCTYCSSGLIPNLQIMQSTLLSIPK